MPRPPKPSHVSGLRSDSRANNKSRDKPAGPNAGANTVRIIGGRWRRRKLQFPPIEGLRPTPDRIRETLFNWLTPQLASARVLDAYCGSGVLGLESLSRGAKHCIFVDRSHAVQQQLKANLEMLECSNAELAQQDFLRWLPQAQRLFDLVFLDPPYDSDRLQASLDALARSSCLAAGSVLYLEHPLGSEPLLTNHWSLLKELKSGNNRYCLLAFTSDELP